MQTISVSDARADFEALLERVVDDRTPMQIVRPDGKGVILVSQSDWEGLQETVYLLSSPANAKRLMEGIARFDAGEEEKRELIQP